MSNIQKKVDNACCTKSYDRLKRRPSAVHWHLKYTDQGLSTKITLIKCGTIVMSLNHNNSKCSSEILALVVQQYK